MVTTWWKYSITCQSNKAHGNHMVETQYNCVKVVPATLAKYLLNPTQFDTEYFLNPSRMDLANVPFLWVTMLIS